MDLLSASASKLSGHPTYAVALSSALLAAPALLVTHAGAGVVLLAAAFVAGAAFLEGRPRPAARAFEVVRFTPIAPRAWTSAGQPRGAWQMVERHGRRELVMRWR